MKSSVLISGVISLLIGASIATPASLEIRQKAPGQGDVNAYCDARWDCCYTSTAACYRQLGYVLAVFSCSSYKYCATSYNIPRTKCNADCCSISTGKGRGCPGK